MGHEFRVLARKYGWLVKKIGVESLFGNRKGVLQYLQYQFTPISLLLRSQPDMLLRGNKDVIEAFEAKAVEDKWPNVAVEAWQLLYLYRLCRMFGIETNYVFGWPEDDRLDGVIIPVSRLPVTRFYITPRFKRWPPDLRDSLYNLIRDSYDSIEMHELADGHGGSGDPYLIFPKDYLWLFVRISAWFDQRGTQSFGMKDRISWEGEKEAKALWKSYRYTEWLRAHQKKTLYKISSVSASASSPRPGPSSAARPTWTGTLKTG